MTTTTTDPWGPSYVPPALRTRPVPAPITWVDPDAQQRGQDRVQLAARPTASARGHRARAAILRTVYAVDAALRRAVGWTVRGVLVLAKVAALVAVTALIAEYGPSAWQEFVAIGKPESSAVQLVKPLECAARTAIDAPVEGYTARQNRSFELSGVIESDEDYVQVWSPARDAACAGLDD